MHRNIIKIRAELDIASGTAVAAKLIFDTIFVMHFTTFKPFSFHFLAGLFMYRSNTN